VVLFILHAAESLGRIRIAINNRSILQLQQQHQLGGVVCYEFATNRLRAWLHGEATTRKMATSVRLATLFVLLAAPDWVAVSRAFCYVGL